MQVALRKRHLDVVFDKAVPQREEDVGLDVDDPVRRVVDPETQQEVDAVVAEFGDMAERLGRGLDPSGLLRGSIASRRTWRKSLPYATPNARSMRTNGLV